MQPPTVTSFQEQSLPVTMDSEETSTSDNTYHYVIMPLQITCDCLRACFGALALASNSLMIAAFIRYPSLRTKTNILLINLSIIDCMAGIVNLSVPLVHYVVADDGIITKVYFFLLGVSSFGEVTALLLIGGERYLHVAHPLKYSSLVTLKRIIKVLLGSWTVLLLMVTIISLNSENIADKFLNHSGDIIPLIMSIWVQVLIISTLYSATYLYVRKHFHRVHPHGIPVNMSYRYRLFKMTTIIVSVYMISIGPSLVSGTLVAVKVLEPKEYLTYCLDISRVFFTIQTWINPMIYAWKNKQLRVAFRKLLRLQTSSPAVINQPNIGINLN